MNFRGFWVYANEALSNLLASKLRSFLALLGILVGTGSVVALVSIGELATKNALDQIRALGTDMFAISFHEEKITNNDEDTNDLNDLTQATYTRMAQQFDDIKRIAPYATTYESLSFEGKELEGNIIGADDGLALVLKIGLADGRFISHLDQNSFYAVIGDKLAQEIAQNVIGKQIQLGQHIFTIVGVAAPWVENSFFYQDINRSVIIPFPSAKLINPNLKLNSAVLQVEESIDPEQLEEEIKAFIDKQYTGYRMYAFSARQIIQSLASQQKTLTIFLGVIGGISLLVGGIGVMNIMLMSVVERRREIGIRRAIGAKRRDIQWLFLIESVTLTLVGGAIGVILGIFSAYIVTYFTGWDFAFFILPPIIGFTVSVAIGIFFGFYPAYKASRLDPIQTLRSD